MRFSKFMMAALVVAVVGQIGCDKSYQGESGEQFAEGQAKPNEFWWPERLDLQPLRQHAAESNPMGERFNYAKEFKSLDLKAVKKDIESVLTTSQEWWPADYGNYAILYSNGMA